LSIEHVAAEHVDDTRVARACLQRQQVVAEKLVRMLVDEALAFIVDLRAPSCAAIFHPCPSTSFRPCSTDLTPAQSRDYSHDHGHDEFFRRQPVGAEGAPQAPGL
jgi:hypothetical protein